MIAGLIGRVHRIQADSIHVNANGVIYRVFTSGRTMTEIGASGVDVELHTHLIVREDAQNLYGFLTEGELRWFETLISVSGVGPRLACAVLTRFSVEELLHAIAEEQVAVLSTVPGIGKRTASRILLDLRGKLPEGAVESARGVHDSDAEVYEALQALGYSLAEAQSAVGKSDVPDEAEIEERLVAALRILGPADA